ncbi:hypothetical protein Tco_1576112 [Tanacetum coccineum]
MVGTTLEPPSRVNSNLNANPVNICKAEGKMKENSLKEMSESTNGEKGDLQSTFPSESTTKNETFCAEDMILVEGEHSKLNALSDTVDQSPQKTEHSVIMKNNVSQQGKQMVASECSSSSKTEVEQTSDHALVEVELESQSGDGNTLMAKNKKGNQNKGKKGKLIKEKLAERREQMAIRAYEEDKRREEWNQKIEEDKRREEWNQKIKDDKRREEWNQKIEELINLIQSFIRNPISPPVTTKVPSKPIQNTPRFEEKSGEGYTSSKEVKDSRFISADVTKVADEYDGKNLPQTDSTLKDSDKNDTGRCIGAPKSANSQDNMNPTWAGDKSRIREKDVPSHGPRKQHMGGQIFGAGLELTVGFNLRAFEEVNCVLGRGQERRTWNPGIT